jgi:uncharacterized protein YkwD
MVLVTKTKRKAAVPKSRHKGHHHRKNDHYLKTYWPYLPMLVIVIAGLTFSNLWGVVQTNILGYATDMSSAGLLQYTNNERTSTGLGALALNSKLNQAAQAKANDMVARDYWSHNTPEGNPPWVFFSAAGYSYVTAGENLAYGFDSSSGAVVGWMNSPGHKANILNNSFVDVGFGIANSDNYQGTGPETVVVAMYGSQVAGAAAPTPAPAPPVAAQTPPPAPPAPTPAPAAPEPAVETPAPVAKEEEKEQNSSPLASTGTNNQQAVGTTKVSRIQLVSGGNAPWSMFAVSAIATISIAIFFLRHGLLLHRVLVRGEAFIHKHPFMDIALVALATAGYVLTRTDGIIR